MREVFPAIHHQILKSQNGCVSVCQKYVSGPKILAKMSQNTQGWLGDLDCGTFLLVSWDSGHNF